MNTNIWIELLRHAAEALAAVALQPFIYVAIAMILLHYRDQTATERLLFAVRLHAYGRETWNRVWTGIVAGLAASAAMLALGAALQPETLAILWVVSVAAVWIRFRFLCLAYAVGVAGALHGLSSIPAVADGLEAIGAGVVADWLQAIDVPSLLSVVGVLHLGEALLIGWTGGRSAMPVFLEGKRGKPVGGYKLQQYWPVPLLLLAPAPAENAAWMFGLVESSSSLLPWKLPFGDGLWESGWWILPFPVLIGFSSLTVSKLPRDKARESARNVALYGTFALLLAFAAEWMPAIAVPAALLALALHEGLVWLDGWLESQRRPLYVHDDRGLKVLAVLPASPAAGLGIQPGEIVRKVNGMPVRSRAELHAALRSNPAFCKLEVLDIRGEVRFLSRSLYAGEHHQLGLLLCPDDEAPYTAAPGPAGLWAVLSPRRARRGHGGASSVRSQEAQDA
ncbi:PDZ domain-containing protein [Paenibacillus thermoaerophilus]|uniref:PDZ domain-containing protein n=1 Tax=Paenibacillus thermoaerophilus TaxID=1215385 RepID=A0ABW2V5M1_9BACL|nr:PDZ domain-containing protein [Paenibacillus thermoaerophilus]TMV09199.1 PDZ domain-containing protein [Paenibacillus thermoaerophilus]